VQRVTTAAQLAAALKGAGPGRGRARAVVMTMGALHAGHLALVRAARERVGEHGQVLATIFVNPLQFGPGEDLAAYPRPLADDLCQLEAAGCDVAFTPTARVMYRDGEPQVRVDPGPLADILEGAIRPDHFAGVLTVVLKLLHLTKPDVALFGEKDYQQLTLIRRMVLDLDVDVRIDGIATVREPDGLALSSRNRHLDPQQRQTALVLSRALAAGSAAGPGGPAAVLSAARAEFEREAVTPDYVEVRSVDLLAAPASGPARLLLAARIGTTRLIDNAIVQLSPPRPDHNEVIRAPAPADVEDPPRDGD
jgi:pantoate--beta-alanine ligase